jgi:high-affinity iron transporter
MFNITAAPTVLETVAYVAYLLPVLAAFLWPARTPAAAPRPPGATPARTTSSQSETTEHVRA